MKKKLATLALIGLHATVAEAIQVNPGDTVRGAYTFTTAGATGVEPVNFQVRLTSLDLLGAGDIIGLRLLDTALTPLSFTRFDSTGTALDPTVGITFDADDFLLGIVGPSVPRSGFLEVVGLAGSFDVASVSIYRGPPVNIRQQR